MNRRWSSQFPTFDVQSTLAFLRLLVFLGLLYFFGAYCGTRFDGVDPRAIATQWKERLFLLQFVNEIFLIPFTVVINPSSMRYMLAPLGAFLFIIISGAFYVKDIYELSSLREGLTYVLASMFGVGYPTVIIDKGSEQKQTESSLIDKVGGPGFVEIEPGNAAMFIALRKPTDVSVSTTYFLGPFETIAQAVNLDDQQGDKNEISAVSRDGIKVVLRDIHLRYRVKQEQKNGKPISRSLSDPYPFERETLQNMLFNLTVQKDGELDPWNTAIERAVVGSITDFVAARSIDFLTAPRSEDNNPRLDMRNELFYSDIRKSLERYGAELLWVDVGHIDIVDECIDEERANLWATKWIGDAAVLRAYGNAKRQAYRELGRAEAQADLILGIADAFTEAGNIESNTAENVRKILLARTAQLLDVLRESKKENVKK